MSGAMRIFTGVLYVCLYLTHVQCECATEKDVCFHRFLSTSPVLPLVDSGSFWKRTNKRDRVRKRKKGDYTSSRIVLSTSRVLPHVDTGSVRKKTKKRQQIKKKCQSNKNLNRFEINA